MSDNDLNTSSVTENDGVRGKDAKDDDKPLVGDVDANWKNLEYSQAHLFRWLAFSAAGIMTIGLGGLWVYVFFTSWPDATNLPTGHTETFILKYAIILGLKVSLVTVLFITVFVTTMRFAIRCFGHHNPKQQDNDSSLSAFVSELLKKTLSSQNPN